MPKFSWLGWILVFSFSLGSWSPSEAARRKLTEKYLEAMRAELRTYSKEVPQLRALSDQLYYGHAVCKNTLATDRPPNLLADPSIEILRKKYLGEGQWNAAIVNQLLDCLALLAETVHFRYQVLDYIWSGRGNVEFDRISENDLPEQWIMRPDRLRKMGWYAYPELKSFIVVLSTPDRSRNLENLAARIKSTALTGNLRESIKAHLAEMDYFRFSFPINLSSHFFIIELDKFLALRKEAAPAVNQSE
jgi:hypothetical protein